MRNRFKPLVIWPFTICLVILILNDFYLKVAFHNAVTGKLSDVCGLFVFAMFWTALFPRYKSWVYLATATFFIFWKSQISQGFIEFFSTCFFSIARTVDVTDLFVLLVLIPAWYTPPLHLQLPFASTSLRKLSAYPMAGITLFSFCATSQPHYIQTFDQPQYVLFTVKGAIDSKAFYEDFSCYTFDSLLVVKVHQMQIPNKAPKDDDYQKNQSIKTLQQDIVYMLKGKVALMGHEKITSMTIKTPQGDDSLRFKGGHLDGKFIRKKGNRIVIEGWYKDGLEDSTWIFRDSSGSAFTKTTFLKGEKTKVQQFRNSQLTGSKNIDTRADTLKNKGMQLGFVVLVLLAIIFILIRNYRRSPEKLKLRPLYKWILSFTLPIIVWSLQLGITILLGDYHFDIFLVVFIALLTYLITCPLFFIIIFWIKFSREIDILWYILLFALGSVIWIEYTTFLSLSA